MTSLGRSVSGSADARSWNRLTGPRISERIRWAVLHTWEVAVTHEAPCRTSLKFLPVVEKATEELADTCPVADSVQRSGSSTLDGAMMVVV